LPISCGIHPLLNALTLKVGGLVHGIKDTKSAGELKGHPQRVNFVVSKPFGFSPASMTNQGPRQSRPVCRTHSQQTSECARRSSPHVPPKRLGDLQGEYIALEIVGMKPTPERRHNHAAGNQLSARSIQSADPSVPYSMLAKPSLSNPKSDLPIQTELTNLPRFSHPADDYCPAQLPADVSPAGIPCSQPRVPWGRSHPVTEFFNGCPSQILRSVRAKGLLSVDASSQTGHGIRWSDHCLAEQIKAIDFLCTAAQGQFS